MQSTSLSSRKSEFLVSMLQYYYYACKVAAKGDVTLSNYGFCYPINERITLILDLATIA